MESANPSIKDLLAPYVGATGGLLSSLRAVNDALGHLPPETEEIAAEVFNLSRAEIKGVISFYADFRRTPPTGPTVRLCVAEACQAAGGRQVEHELKAAYSEADISAFGGGTSGDVDQAASAIDYRPVYCLGLCSVAPAALVGDRLVGRANLERIKTCLAAAGEKTR